MQNIIFTFTIRICGPSTGGEYSGAEDYVLFMTKNEMTFSLPQLFEMVEPEDSQDDNTYQMDSTRTILLYYYFLAMSSCVRSRARKAYLQRARC
jgi:hypothetical protein